MTGNGPESAARDVSRDSAFRFPEHQTFHVTPFSDAGPHPVFVTALLKRARHCGAVMTPVPSFQSGALSILQQAVHPSASNGAANTAGVNLVATANGVAPPSGSDGAGPAQQAKAKVSEALFKPNAPSATEMKLHLMKRLGEKLGVSLEDHETHASFGSAVRFAIDEIKSKPSGVLVLSAIERELGFDKLGFSLDTFVNAVIDPNGSDGKKVDAALKAHLGLDNDDDKAADARSVPAALQLDENGLYDRVKT